MRIARPSRRAGQLALIAALTALVAVLALCFGDGFNGDVYLGMATGRALEQQGFVQQDPFPTIAEGERWLNLQWFANIAFFRVVDAVGTAGLAILYALLLALPLALLLWLCRHKGPAMLVAVTVLYFPGVLAVVHPRAAGFTLLIFSTLVALLVIAWRAHPRTPRDHRRFWVAAAAIPLLFILWSNLHGGFLAGLALIGLVFAGAAVDRWRGLPDAVGLPRTALLAALGAIAVGAVTVATPLGTAIWDYLASFQGHSLAIATEEWGPSSQSPLALVYIALAACFAGWLWLRSRPRRAVTLLVVAGFIALAAVSLRNIVFVGPIVGLLVAWSAPNTRPEGSHLGPAGAAAGAALAVAAVWATLFAPATAGPQIRSPAVSYAIDNPPERGRLLVYAGVGSYINWRSPETPVVMNGWLEHYERDVIRGNYGVLRGWAPHLRATLRELEVGGVIAHVPLAIERLQRHGFEIAYEAEESTYLVRRGAGLP